MTCFTEMTVLLAIAVSLTGHITPFHLANVATKNLSLKIKLD